eukprot:1419741-Prymnesium_polylepis.1
MARVLKPGGVACCAFTNRCFPTKARAAPRLCGPLCTRLARDLVPFVGFAHAQVVPVWTRPFTEAHHAKVVGAYYHFSSPSWTDIGVADVSPDGWAGQRDPAVVVIGRKEEGWVPLNE